jgi:neutral ceramidase
LSNFATSWFGTRHSFISAVRIRNIFLVGLPADVSAGVVRELDEVAAKNGMQVIVTSFNGSWRGYFTRPETFDAHSVYETRTMALLGKYGGDYFTHLSKKLCQKMLNCK